MNAQRSPVAGRAAQYPVHQGQWMRNVHQPCSPLWRVIHVRSGSPILSVVIRRVMRMVARVVMRAAMSVVMFSWCVPWVTWCGGKNLWVSLFSNLPHSAMLRYTGCSAGGKRTRKRGERCGLHRHHCHPNPGSHDHHLARHQKQIKKPPANQTSRGTSPTTIHERTHPSCDSHSSGHAPPPS